VLQTHIRPYLTPLFCPAILWRKGNWRLNPFLRLFTSQPFEEKEQRNHDGHNREQPQAAPAPTVLLHISSPNLLGRELLDDNVEV
jgi:hypothetical protein